MGYGAYEPVSPAGLRRFTDHTPDGNTVAHWTFDKDDTDQVGAYDQNGIATNEAYCPIFGKSADARCALASQITVGYGVTGATGLKALTEMTVACWFCPTTPPITVSSIVGFRNPGAGSGDPNTYNFAWDLLYRGTGEAEFVWQSGNKLSYFAVGPVLELGKWVHLSATRNSSQSTARIYVNGARMDEFTEGLPFDGGSAINKLSFMGDNVSRAPVALLATTIVKNVEIDDAAAAALYRSTLVGF